MTDIQEKRLKIKYFFSSFLKYLILCLGAFLALLPIIVVFIGSFKTNNEFLTSSVFSLPKTWDFSNYKVAFSQGQMGTGFKNTFIILLITMILNYS